MEDGVKTLVLIVLVIINATLNLINAVKVHNRDKEIAKLKVEIVTLEKNLSAFTDKSKAVTIDGHQYLVMQENGKPSTLVHSPSCPCKTVTGESK